MTKPPAPASLKKVTTQNLVQLGAERLAEILVAAGDARPELKRRLRMELAAAQGPEALGLEIDRRVARIAASRGRVSWRQRPALVRELDSLSALILQRLAELDRAAAAARAWAFLALAPGVATRVRDKDGAVAAVFAKAAGALAAVLGPQDAPDLAAALARDVETWSAALEPLLAAAPAELAQATLRSLAEAPDPTPGRIRLLRQLADAAGDVDAYRATFSTAVLRTAAGAAEVAQRLLQAGRIADAGELLGACDRGANSGRGPGAAPDPLWESAWIAYLEASGEAAQAQALRWTAFERDLSVEHGRAFIRRLADFDDVEAETRAFAHAAAHPEAGRALQLFIDWPALAEAARLIQARAGDLQPSPEQGEAWAAALRGRYPQAAETVLRRAAAVAFRRGERATSHRLSAAADALSP